MSTWSSSVRMGLALALGGALAMGRPLNAQGQKGASSASQAPRAVVVIDSGETGLMVESLVRATVESELEARGFEIPSGVSVGGEIPGKLLACSGELECTRRLLDGIETDRVIFLSLRPETSKGPNNFKIIARDFDVASGETIGRSMDRCPECKEEVDLSAFTKQVIDALFERVRVPRQPAPPTPPPTLVPAPAPPPPTRPVPTRNIVTNEVRGESSNIWNYLGIGAGVAALGLGATLLVIDGPVVDDGVRQPQRYDTRTPGYISMGVGLALIGISAGMWALDDDEGWVATIDPSGSSASFSFSGEF